MQSRFGNTVVKFNLRVKGNIAQINWSHDAHALSDEVDACTHHIIYSGTLQTNSSKLRTMLAINPRTGECCLQVPKAKI